MPQRAEPSGPSRHEGRDRLPAGLLAALFLGMLAVRPQLLAIGPLLPEIQDDLAITHAEAGLLTTIPVVCMGLFAPLGPQLAGRIGARRAVALCLVLIALFAGLRAVAPGALAVIALTVPLGLGMGIVTGATAAAALAVPLSLALGGWRQALIALGIAGLASIVAWAMLSPRDAGRAADGPRPPRLPWGAPRRGC